jgi:hypothetical protein
MGRYSPSGVAWVSYHGDRLFNSVEYLRLHGYFSNYGYSVWSSCSGCDLTSASWHGQIYLSYSALKFFPYIILNHFGSESVFRYYGPLVDKVVIFVTGYLVAEILIKCVRNFINLPRVWVGGVSFALFAFSPWTYKMITAAWMEIWFLMLFLFAMLMFNVGKNRVAYVSFFCACMMHYQWGVVVGFIYGSVFFLGSALSEFDRTKCFLPEYAHRRAGALVLFILSIIPVMLEVLTRTAASYQLNQLAGGTSLLTRIGISGGDMHNGGILGALQFMGGVRITQCFSDGAAVFSGTLDQKITAFNCVLSVGSMVLVSVFAIGGVVFLLKASSIAKAMVFPISISFMVFVAILQQSLSAHLLGYSYIFAFLFSAGLVGCFTFISMKVKTQSIALVVTTPLVVSVIVLSIRISMLGGV